MATVTRRRMTDRERRYVEEQLEDENSRIVGTGNVLKTFIRRLKYSALIVFILIGAVVMIAAEVGFDVFSLGLVLLAGTVIAGLALSVVIAIFMTWRFFTAVTSAYDPEDAEDARKALADGQVIEEVHEIIDAKQVVMEDEDGLTYFLLTLDNRVFYWEDEESEDLWCDDESIFDSKARPRSKLIVTRTSVGDIEFDVRFEGAPVPFKSGMRFRKGAEDEFDCDDFVDAIIWDDIESRYTRAA